MTSIHGAHRALAKSVRKLELMSIIDKIPEEMINDASMWEEINNFCPDPKMFNQMCADFHNITLEILISSPNMDKLNAQFYVHIRQLSIDTLMKKGMTREQANALFEYGEVYGYE